MSTFLAKWASAAPKQAAGKPTVLASFVACQVDPPWHVKRITPSEHASPPRAADCETERKLAIAGVGWAEWKAATLNRLFQEQGITGQSGGITAKTVRHGEACRKRVDSAASNEQPMSLAER
jgi:hypothetical protein